MKFALIDNIKVTAIKGAKGLCTICGSELVAKCGNLKVNHWAHKSIRNCDPWWENETEWHRDWKNHFTNDWQEVVLTDEITGEKHIADILSPYGLVIEFQHSHIHPIERTMRERFYKNMVWVVDGTRLKRDYPRFLKAKDSFRSTNKQGHFLVDFIEECFPSTWLDSSVPVIFDFKGTDVIVDQKDWRNHLYFLYPKSKAKESIVAIISRLSLIHDITNGGFLEEKREPEKQVEHPQTKSISTISKRPSQYVFDRGRFVKRKRF
jgi:competence protein CoiA